MRSAQEGKITRENGERSPICQMDGHDETRPAEYTRTRVFRTRLDATGKVDVFGPLRRGTRDNNRKGMRARAPDRI